MLTVIIKTKMIPTYYPNAPKLMVVIDVSQAAYHTELFEIEGIVSAESQSGSFREEGYKVHMFSFAAWRVGNSPEIIHKKLLVLRPVDASTDYLRDIKPYAVLKIIAYLDVQQERAVFETCVVVNDAEDTNLNRLVCGKKRLGRDRGRREFSNL